MAIYDITKSTAIVGARRGGGQDGALARPHPGKIVLFIHSYAGTTSKICVVNTFWEFFILASHRI